VQRLDALGKIALATGYLEQAGARYREALALAEDLAALEHIAGALCGLGEVALAVGDVPAARRHYRRALQAALEDLRLDSGRRVLLSLAKWRVHKGERELAAEFITLTLNLRPDLGYEAEALQRELRSALSPDVYAAAEERGRARDLETTLKELLAELEPQYLTGFRGTCL
jgi:tetratricopeptide (TPR) repeat protein